MNQTLTMKKLLFLFFPISVLAQEIPPKAKVIVIKNMGYQQVLDALLTKGYEIESRDAELKTVRTGAIVYPRYWNGAYKINVRVKDSVAYFSGIYLCPYETQLTSLLVGVKLNEAKWDNNHFIYNRTNKKGQPQVKSMEGYPFWLMNDFVKTLSTEIEYRTD